MVKAKCSRCRRSASSTFHYGPLMVLDTHLAKAGPQYATLRVTPGGYLRLVLSAFLALACGAQAASPELGQLDASPTLFTVMAALNAVGLDAGLDAPSNHPLRNEIRAKLASRNIPSSDILCMRRSVCRQARC